MITLDSRAGERGGGEAARRAAVEAYATALLYRLLSLLRYSSPDVSLKRRFVFKQVNV